MGIFGRFFGKIETEVSVSEQPKSKLTEVQVGALIQQNNGNLEEQYRIGRENGLNDQKILWYINAASARSRGESSSQSFRQMEDQQRIIENEQRRQKNPLAKPYSKSNR